MSGSSSWDSGSHPGKSSRLRVLTITTTFPAVAGDGTPEFVLTLAAGLAGDHDVTVLAPRVAGAARTETIDGVRVRRVAYFPRRWEGLADGAILPNLRARPWRVIEVPFLAFALVAAAKWEVLRHRPDVVHAHWLLPAGWIAAFLSVVFRVPFVLTVHGADAYALNGRVLQRVKRAILRRAAVVSPVSADIADRLALPAENVVPMPVDCDAIAGSVGKRQPRPGKVLFVGRLAEKKGVDVLLGAVAETPKAQLTVVGDGPLGDALRRQAKALGTAERVTFTGQQPRHVVAEQLRTASLVAIPSRVAADGDQEGTPVILLEAMAAGIPVVASRLGGLAEQVRDRQTGTLVTPGSVAELATALAWALEHPEDLESMAQRAREHVRDVADLPAVARRYATFLRQAAGRG